MAEGSASVAVSATDVRSLSSRKVAKTASQPCNSIFAASSSEAVCASSGPKSFSACSATLHWLSASLTAFWVVTISALQACTRSPVAASCASAASTFPALSALAASPVLSSLSSCWMTELTCSSICWRTKWSKLPRSVGALLNAGSAESSNWCSNPNCLPTLITACTDFFTVLQVPCFNVSYSSASMDSSVDFFFAAATYPASPSFCSALASATAVLAVTSSPAASSNATFAASAAAFFSASTALAASTACSRTTFSESEPATLVCAASTFDCRTFSTEVRTCSTMPTTSSWIAWRLSLGMRRLLSKVVDTMLTTVSGKPSAPSIIAAISSALMARGSLAAFLTALPMTGADAGLFMGAIPVDAM
mmetsp:Transcript_113254/g.283652  ORF Transcript_113254/g.283652 Transcript_113254/m.283652 type:complete len:365 (+) Transcript_113254:279-1373(+)